MSDTQSGQSESASSADALAGTTDPGVILPYEPRTFAPLELWQIREFTTKPYWISADRTAVSPDRDLVDAARACVANSLDTIEDLGHHQGLGFVVMHHGTAGIWLLNYWWAFDSVFCTLRWHAEGKPPWRFRAVEELRINACVWEGIVVEHERQAWVRTMLRSDPDAARYLKDRLPPGQY